MEKIFLLFLGYGFPLLGIILLVILPIVEFFFNRILLFYW